MCTVISGYRVEEVNEWFESNLKRATNENTTLDCFFVCVNILILFKNGAVYSAHTLGSQLPEIECGQGSNSYCIS